MKIKIPFNKPWLSGRELEYIKQAADSGHLSGNGMFTRKCRTYLEERLGSPMCLLTTSCTDALEMSAMLLDIKEGDEVIVPAYTFVSTALAFSRQGAKIVFADSKRDNPCIDEKKLESLITERTKVLVPVHYNGVPCEMDTIMKLAGKYDLRVVEDSAHAFGSRYKGRHLGTIGHLGCFSFHETKIIHCGEGGMLSVNDSNFKDRAEILWEKGTNRAAFKRGEVDKYEWIDTGSSFLMSDINAAFLLSQLNFFEEILARRKKQWELYYSLLKDIQIKGIVGLSGVVPDLEINYSGFYLTTRSNEERKQLIEFLNSNGIQAVSHYIDLSQSPYIKKYQNDTVRSHILNVVRFQDTLLRLPLYHTLEFEQISEIAALIKKFYGIEKG